MGSVQNEKERQLKILITGFGPFKSIADNPSWMAVKPLHGTLLDLNAEPTLRKEKPPQATTEQDRPAASTALIQTIQVPVHYGSVLDIVPRIHGQLPVSPSANFWHDERLDRKFGGKSGESYPQGYPVQHPASEDGGEGGSYDVVIHVGVGKTGSLRCETQAHKTGYNIPDANRCLAPVLDELKVEDLDLPDSFQPKDGKVRGFGQGYQEYKDTEITPIDVPDLVEWLKKVGMSETEVEQSFDPGRYLCDFIFYCSMCEAQRKNKSANTTVRTTDVIFIHVPPVDQDLSVERCREAIYAIAWYLASRRLVEP